MKFNEHSDLAGVHAFLSGSRYSWVNYDERKLSASYLKFLAVQKGTELHDLARRLILFSVKLPKSKRALNMFVNDAIGYRMTPEQPLFYSYNAFGTPDAISFRDSFLRIHDLKTGVSRVSLRQLEIYASLFCLEYDVKPHDIGIELRIYQEGNDVLINLPDPDNISDIIAKIIVFDKRIDKIRMENDYVVG